MDNDQQQVNQTADDAVVINGATSITPEVMAAALQAFTTPFTGVQCNDIAQPFWTITCPCGVAAQFPLNGFPTVDTPHPCTSPNHWSVKFGTPAVPALTPDPAQSVVQESAPVSDQAQLGAEDTSDTTEG